MEPLTYTCDFYTPALQLCKERIPQGFVCPIPPNSLDLLQKIIVRNEYEVTLIIKDFRILEACSARKHFNNGKPGAMP